MKPSCLIVALSVALMASAGAMESKPNGVVDADPHLWLEQVQDEKALDWVRAQNKVSTDELTQSDSFKALESRLLSIMDSNERIAYVSKMGEFYYNFWRDAKNERGLWRRTTLAEYRKAEPAWETVIDLDALAKEQGENWVWRGAECLKPDNKHCLVSLSRGGADATVTREFDLQERKFIEGGFELPEAKGGINWRDVDHVYVSTDFGPGSMTTSGYPRQVKLWKRGTLLAEATLIFEGEANDVSVGAYRDHSKGFERDIVYRGVTFYTNEAFQLLDGKLVKLDKPDGASVGFAREWMTLELRADWQVGGKSWPAGSLLVINADAYLAGKRNFEALFTPTERKSLAGMSTTKNHFLLNELDNVRNRIYVMSHSAQKGWEKSLLPGLPEFGAVSAYGIDDEASDDFFMTVTDYVTPTSLYFGAIGKTQPEKLKSLPAFFNADGLVVSQHQAKSKDGTMIPYFQVARKDLQLSSANPTLLYGYGGFEVSMQPGYSANVGTAWLEKGGVYVVANIRGGGEFGPSWHQAALKANRYKAYEDFEAVAEDLIARKITSTKRLGIQGGSNGGLLVGNMLVRRPDLFAAVVCQVPLLDMQRYHTLLAGASWMGEYGNPDDPKEWQFIQTFSPYHLVKEGVTYPRTLFTTSTRDDRVHPGHARKMMAKMKEQGHDVLYYENIEGGHGGAANNKQSAFMSALAYSFMWRQLNK